MVLVPMEEELQSSYDNSRREGPSTRSTYQRAISVGVITPSVTTGPVAKAQILAPGGAQQMAKLKRIAVTLVVPKTTTLFAGYFGFLRQPEGLIVATRVDFGDAALLRPSVFCSNRDNASYWTAYLPGVNLVGNGVLWLVAVRVSGSSSTCDFVMRYVEERGIS